MGISILFLCFILLNPSKIDLTHTNPPNKEINDQKKPIQQTKKSDTKKPSIDNSIKSNKPKEKNTILSRKDMRQLPAATILDITKVGGVTPDTAFYYEKIKDDIKSRIDGKSYAKDCTVPYEELRYVRVLHYGFDNEIHIGELIVNKAIAADIIDIFKELYIEKYPIEQMLLVDEFDADDDASMAANNASSFNYRVVAGSTSLSKHALGLAIDINPLYNPYVQSTKKGINVLPEEGIEYVDRTLDCPYYIKKKDVCYQAFVKHGFTWGGTWRNKDYQHFQKTLN